MKLAIDHTAGKVCCDPTLHPGVCHEDGFIIRLGLRADGHAVLTASTDGVDS